jgi:hypothetical protein
MWRWVCFLLGRLWHLQMKLKLITERDIKLVPQVARCLVYVAVQPPCLLHDARVHPVGRQLAIPSETAGVRYCNCYLVVPAVVSVSHPPWLSLHVRLGSSQVVMHCYGWLCVELV